MKILPTSDRVLIKKIQREKKGLILTNEPDEFDFIVEAVGCEVMDVEVGDAVIMIPYKAFDMTDLGFMICKEEDILAVVEK